MAKVTIGARSYEVEVKGNVVTVDGHDFPVSQATIDGIHTVTAGGIRYRVQLPPDDARVSGMDVEVDHRPFRVEWEGNLGSGGGQPRTERRASAAAPAAGGAAIAAVKGGVAAQIAGRIVAVKVAVGDAVAAGEVLLLLEAMKMENEIKAPTSGTVASILVSEGQRVAEGETLLVIE